MRSNQYHLIYPWTSLCAWLAFGLFACQSGTPTEVDPRQTTAPTAVPAPISPAHAESAAVTGSPARVDDPASDAEKPVPRDAAEPGRADEPPKPAAPSADDLDAQPKTVVQAADVAPTTQPSTTKTPDSHPPTAAQAEHTATPNAAQRPPPSTPDTPVGGQLEASEGPVRRIVLTEKWSVETMTTSNWDIVTGDKYVYVTSSGTLNAHKVGLEAIDKETGVVAWKKPLVSAAQPFGDVLVTWRPFQVLDANTGKQLWKRKGIVNYIGVASDGERLAFISIERNPLRYRLTVTEMRSGHELYHVESPGRHSDGIDRDISLSFDANGLWVVDRLIPEEPEARAATWSSIVESIQSPHEDFPCHAVSTPQLIVVRNPGQLLQLWDRRDGTAPRWRIKNDEFPNRCWQSKLLIDKDRVYYAAEYRTSDAENKASSNGKQLRLMSLSTSDGSILWQNDEIHYTRGLLPMPFGLLLPGSAEGSLFGASTGPTALDHNGKEVDVVGHLPHRSVVDNGIIYAREKGRVMRIEIRTEP